MQLEYDQEADALYLSLQQKYVHESQEVAPGIVVDLDEQGGIIGIEILDVSAKVPEQNLVNFSIKNLAKLPA